MLIMYLVDINTMPLVKKSPVTGRHAMSDRRAWSDAEKTIAVYFRSRKVSVQSLHCLLLRRGFDRSADAIEGELRTIIDEHPYLGTSIDCWDASAVDCWIDDLLGDTKAVNNLILLTAQDAEIIANVSHIFQESFYFGAPLAHLR